MAALALVRSKTVVGWVAITVSTAPVAAPMRSSGVLRIMASVSYRAKLLSIDLRASYHDSVSHSDGGLACNNHNVVLGMTH